MGASKWHDSTVREADTGGQRQTKHGHGGRRVRGDEGKEGAHGCVEFCGFLHAL
jgi:hypothetical protein